jgi:hypothetical protein
MGKRKRGILKGEKEKGQGETILSTGFTQLFNSLTTAFPQATVQP